MDPESMRKCMSLGYSSKTSNTTIGQCNYSLSSDFIFLHSLGAPFWKFLPYYISSELLRKYEVNEIVTEKY